jgi:prepilin signal peptidase PulO-like enzyme (type II secretory pathway)
MTSGRVFYPIASPAPFSGGAVLLWLVQSNAVTGKGLWGNRGIRGFAALYWGYRLLRHQEGLGYGDVKFLAALGAWHGWEALPLLIFVAASLASGTACLMMLKHRNMQIIKNPLPFGPFLAGAGLIVAY